MELVAGLLIADRYRLDRRLGMGGMGEVWAATHTVTGRASALKFVRTRVDSGEESKQRFEREARASTAVSHPNVIEVRDYFWLEDGTPVMVMDLLAGESLRDRLTRAGRLTVEETCTILAQVISAVGAAHAAGVVHRDLKPDNIFLARSDDGAEVAKVLDFGVAKLIGASELPAQLTEPGVIMGTPWYMAPEQASGEHDVDERADVWAIGVIAYECLSGDRPVRGDNLGKVLLQVLSGSIAPLATVTEGVPADLIALVGLFMT
ncbi:MAG: serine/threonine-protein kinase, partial [Polyangiales bacterium]